MVTDCVAKWTIVPRGDDLMDVVVAREQKMNKKKRRHEEYLCRSLN